MSAMSNQHLIITEAMSRELSVPYEVMENLEYTVWDIVSASDNEFVWHVSYDDRLFKVTTNKISVVSVERIR